MNAIRTTLFYLCASLMASLSAAPLVNFPSALPIHTITTLNITGYIGAAVAKARAYKQLRALLINQLETEAEVVAAQESEQPEAVVRQPQTDSTQMISHVKHAPKKELISIASKIIQQRKMFEQMYGDYLLAEKIGFQQNEMEKVAVAKYQDLIKSIIRYETLQPQLGLALLGTGAATVFTALRQLGLIS